MNWNFYIVIVNGTSHTHDITYMVGNHVQNTLITRLGDAKSESSVLDARPAFYRGNSNIFHSGSRLDNTTNNKVVLKLTF